MNQIDIARRTTGADDDERATLIDYNRMRSEVFVAPAAMRVAPMSGIDGNDLVTRIKHRVDQKRRVKHLDCLEHIFVDRISVETARFNAGAFFECFQIEGAKVIGLYGMLRCATRQDGFATSRKSRDVV